MPPWQLFLLAVLIWGTTWHAILYQLAHVSPEVGVTLRFALAGAGLLLICVWRGERWRLTRGEHLRVAFQGIFMYSVAYLCVYHGERHVPSGLVAVGYSASPLVMGVASHLLWGTPLSRRLLLGGSMGMVGVALIFWPEIVAVMNASPVIEASPAAAPAAAPAAGQHSLSGNAALGLAFTLGAVALSAVGSLVASRNAVVGLPLWPALAWGMLWSSLVSAGFALAAGHSFALPASLSFWASLLYLSAFGSVIAFACYLVLQQRWGPGQASMVGVATPVLALVISTLWEGYRPGASAVLGVALAVGGNWLALRPVRPAAATT
ncbi:MAG: EamA family transporter [Rubrivivax sp.]|nr:EamA family transporter [Rubrivivax sp.]